MPQKSGRLLVRVAPGVRAARGGNAIEKPLETSVEVPGLYSLAVQQLSAEIARDEQEEPSEVLVVSFNHSVLESQLPGKIDVRRLPLKHPDPKQQAQFDQHSRGQPYPWNEQKRHARYPR